MVRWNGSSACTIGSNAYGVQPIGSAKRQTKGKGEQKIKKPAVVPAYNQGMGGVDLLDRVLSNLRPVICGKKRYWPLVINAINIAFVCSWRLHNIVFGETIPQKNLRRHIVDIMIRQSKPRVISVDSRPTKARKVADEKRNDGLGHYLISCSV